MNELSIPKYKIKCLNEDFVVTEVPLVPELDNPKDSQYTYLWVEKSGHTTFDAQDEIKNYFGLDYSEINLQGLKDEDAITSQIFSIKKIIPDSEIDKFNNSINSKDKFIRIAKVIGTGKSPVRERCLHGNTFTIVIRGLSVQAAKDLKAFCGERTNFTFINYYDNQRFGMPGGPYNSHLIGRDIVNGDWAEALKKIMKTKDGSCIDNSTRKNKPLFDSFNPLKLKFYVNSYSSSLWNQAASTKVKSLNPCRKVTFDNVASLFMPLKSDYISSSQLSSDGFDFDTEKKRVIKKRKSRNLVTHTVVYSSDVRRDSLNNNKKAITLSFLLPTGCYATMMVRQLMLYSCLK